MVMLYKVANHVKVIKDAAELEKTTALSTAEAEYCSASAAGCEVLYLGALLERLGIKLEQKKPSPI